MGEERRKLMENLRQSYAAQPVLRPGVPASKPGFATPAPPVAEHEAFRRVQLAKAAGDALGVASPYFRCVDAVSGTCARIDGRWVENFAAYDYLSLNADPSVTGAAADAAREWGVSATASRLVGGERSFHRRLEAELADFLGTEAAVALVSGHATNHAIVRTLMEPGDLVLVDRLAHNSIFEGIRASGADHLSFPHNDLDWVEDQLKQKRGAYKRVLIAVEGLYSMDGDMPNLPRLVEIKNRHGAWLMVDEAHSIGVLGATGRGVCEEQGVPPQAVDILMGTLSKTLCSCGGFVAGNHDLCELLRHSAPGFVFSVGLSAPNVAAARAALARLRAEPRRVDRLRALGRTFAEAVRVAKLDNGLSQGFAIGPVIVGDSLRAARLSNGLLAAGFNVLPIIAPAVPERSARLRFFLNADHDAAQIEAVIAETARLMASGTGEG